MGGANSFTMNILGLPEGLYSFIFYTAGRQDFPRATTIYPEGASSVAITTSGLYQGALSEGVTHATFARTVDSDGIVFDVFSPADGFLNGLQIAPVPEPGMSVLLGLSLIAASLRRKR